jgi:ribosomal protein S18 acetylase RimI-like enzyme
MDRTQARIRPYRVGDLDDLYRICLLTGDAGQDGTSLYRDPRLLGNIFAAPYGLYEPSLAFVAEDPTGVGGYIVGALDSPAFERLLDRNWWPHLRSRYPEPPPGLPAEQWTRDQRMAAIIHHPLRSPDELARRYPSHLHINLVPRMQASGHGSRLTRTLIGVLRDQGSCGVHLYVPRSNRRAAGFYRHFGFTELPAPELSGLGVHLFGMDLRQAS